MSTEEPRAKPPKILKPRYGRGKAPTHDRIRELAFNQPYYREKTGNWGESDWPGSIKLTPILTIVKDEAHRATEEHASLIEKDTRFSKNGEDSIQIIYSTFLQRIQRRYDNGSLGGEYYELIQDMLSSTENALSDNVEDRRWLFKWAVGDYERSKARSTRRENEKSRAKPEESSDLSSSGSSGLSMQPRLEARDDTLQNTVPVRTGYKIGELLNDAHDPDGEPKLKEKGSLSR
ncbi:hypothetical protein H072_10010 [Dactylellina haptotyla CBS 200.50]|uniref:Uncharacterized protein n=1 Tax=Dactylellina haptotyla (strain CBS 200.50) TaxID=1284197 RepID=S8BMN7_DACHA|nr:hypothetical protein H072_10010 [Dactylellina haptotyla CBS 200.50]